MSAWVLYVMLLCVFSKLMYVDHAVYHSATFFFIQ